MNIIANYLFITISFSLICLLYFCTPNELIYVTPKMPCDTPTAENPLGGYIDQWINCIGQQGGSGVLTVGYTNTSQKHTANFNVTSENKGNSNEFNVMNPYMAINFYISTGRSLL